MLSPAVAVIVRDLGIGSWIIARHGYDVWSPASLPVVGDQAGIDYEALIESRPTHILTEWGARPLPPKLESLAKERGWTLQNFETLKLGDLRETTRRLAMLDPRQPAWDDHPLKREMDRAWAPHDKSVAGAGRVLLIISAQPTVAVLGPRSAHHDILKLIGGVPAVTEGSPYQELDAEDIRHMAPDAIVLIRPRTPDQGDQGPTARELTNDEIDSLLGAIAKLDIPAVKLHRIGLIDHPLALLPSTSLIRFADDLASLLEKWGRSIPKDPKPSR